AWSRSATTTCMPASASAKAVPRPMPLPAPVTTATLPARSLIASSSASTTVSPALRPIHGGTIGTMAPARDSLSGMASDVELRGVYVPLVTPFADDGSIAVDAIETLCHEYIDAGAAGIVALGTTGEAP